MQQDNVPMNTRAFHDYFLHEWQQFRPTDTLGLQSTAEDLVRVCVDKARGEMDWIDVEWKLTDHCVHWLLIIEVAHEPELEIALDPIPLVSLTPMNIQTFLRSLVITVSEQNAGLSSLPAVKEISEGITVLLSSCPMCNMLVQLQEVVIPPNGWPEYHFRVNVGGRVAGMWATFKIEHPR